MVAGGRSGVAETIIVQWKVRLLPCQYTSGLLIRTFHRNRDIGNRLRSWVHLALHLLNKCLSTRMECAILKAAVGHANEV